MEIPGLTRSQPAAQDTPTGAGDVDASQMDTDQESQQPYQVPNIRPDLQAKIAAMRAQIKQKQLQASPVLQKDTEPSFVEAPATSSVSILDRVLAAHGLESMSDPEDAMEEAQDDSDSDTSSYVSSDETDSDDESSVNVGPLTAEERERILIAADNEGVSSNEIPKTKNEITIDEEPVQVPDFIISSSEEIQPLGTISNIVGSSCVVTGTPSSDARVLDCGTLLVFEDRKNLGFIADTFGPVVAPMFCVRFNSVQELEDAGVHPGKAVYMVPKYAKYVFGDTLLVKGTDASNIHDEEQSETEFSDDEKEALYKLQKKQQRRAGKSDTAHAHVISRPLNDLESIAMSQGMTYDARSQQLGPGPNDSTQQPSPGFAPRGGHGHRARASGGRPARGRPEVNNYGHGPGNADAMKSNSPSDSRAAISGDRPAQGYQRAFYQSNEAQTPTVAAPSAAATPQNNVPTLYQPLQRPS